MQVKSEAAVRRDKLQALRELGIDPYPSETPEFMPLSEARQVKVGGVVGVAGRITGMRTHGRATFFDLTDEETKLQLYLRFDLVGEDNYEFLKFYDAGDYLWAKGEIFTTHAGELSLKVSDFRLLSKSLLPIPDSWQGLKDVETRYRQRTLDFKVNPQARLSLKTRTKVIQTIRQFFDKRDFLEVQTPILQPIPGGAAAKPFITHYNILGTDFYLRVSPELYHKRLIAGGFDRVYEIGPNFRNEGLSHMHNPEFTSCEFYWAYKTSRDLMVVTQELIQTVVTAVKGEMKLTYQGQLLNFAGNFPTISFARAIEQETGIEIEKEDTPKKLKEAVKIAGLKLDLPDKATWPELADELFKKTVRPKIIQPIFVTDHPSELSPLAKTDPKNPRIVQRFQLVAGGGFELVNAYSELNDPLEQEKRFKTQMKLREAGWEEAQRLDKNFLEALMFGMPPTAGWGMGIDRLLMILTDNHSIKEVIPFPTLKPKN